KDDLQVPWEWLSQSESGTLVGYMGVKQLPNVVKRLLDGGMRPETPAALIERGTTAVQRQVTGTLKTLPEIAVQQNVKPPALFIIGPTVELVDDLIWREPEALSGKRVMVTRPSDQAVEMYRVLRRLGAEVLPLPTIATHDHLDNCGWSELKALDFNAGRPHWIVFTSENGVRYFIRQVYESGYDYRFLVNFKFASMGSGTDRALQEYHMTSDFIPSIYTSKVLAEEFSEHIKGQNAVVIRVRGNLGDDTIELALMKSGTKVIPLTTYHTFTAAWDAGMHALLDEQPPDVITFTSGSTATALVEILGKERAIELTKNALIVSIGPMTTRIAEAEGLKVDLEAETHSVPGVVEALVKHFQDL
ncbi:uroporphyrinogen-III synthase, partial [bacterium]|nr:uroporphyrinogen-III synthase [bacterium]